MFAFLHGSTLDKGNTNYSLPDTDIFVSVLTYQYWLSIVKTKTQPSAQLN